LTGQAANSVLLFILANSQNRQRLHSDKTSADAANNEPVQPAHTGLSDAHMREAIRLSIHNVDTGAGGPFGAVVVKDGVIIARGSNSVTATNDPTAHAEVVAIREACRLLNTFQLQGCEIYTSCEPCPMCLGAIYWARPDRLYYANTKLDAAAIGFDDQFIYEELEKPVDKRRLFTRQILREEALSAFRSWNSSDLKTEY
jgi:guanine deaminase